MSPAHHAHPPRQRPGAAPDQPTRARSLLASAVRRARRRRRRVLLGAAVLAATATILAVVLSALGHRLPGLPAASPVAARTATETPGTAPAPAHATTSAAAPTPPQPSETPATPLTYLTPSEIRAVLPEAESFDAGGEWQWFDVQGVELTGACGITPLDGVGPLYSMQSATWGKVSRLPDSEYPMMFVQAGANMHIFTDGDHAEAYAAAFQDSAQACPASDEHDPAVLRDAARESGASLVTGGDFSDGAYSMGALAVRGRYASSFSARVPAPDTEQGYAQAARGVAQLAAFSATRAAAAGLP